LFQRVATYRVGCPSISGAIPKEFALLLTASFFSLMLAEGRKKFMSWSRVVLMMVV